MYIQTNEEDRIVSVMEKSFIDDEGNEVEQDTTGYFEFEFPEDFDLSKSYEYIVKDGKLIYSMSDESKMWKIAELQSNLLETDYISAKMNDSIMCCTTVDEILQVSKEFNEKYGAILEERQAWRDEINELKSQITI